jgi:TonB family protein
MNDPVSVELAQRAQIPVAWRPALGAAFGLHVVVAIALLVAPHHRGRPLTLPHVQVRLGQILPASAPATRGASAGADNRPAPRRAPVKAPPPKTKRVSEPAPTHQRALAPAKPSHPATPPPKHAQQQGTAHAAPAVAQAPGTAPATAPAADAGAPIEGRAGSPHGVAIGAGGNGETPFPFSYYLDRTLTMIEANWYRPPVDSTVRCRVLVRLDRSGRVITAALEEPSASPVFDRAALRAVWAAAPFPQFPQGFGGTTLTLHLEFGP